MREGNEERGFTLVELMIVVGIVAILAAVVIPTFMKESTRGKAKSEVAPMFAELGNREDQYKLESNTSTYLTTTKCPTAASRDGTDVTNPVPACAAEWTTLRVVAPTSKLTCAYTVRAGITGEDPKTDGEWPTWVLATDIATPGTGWYFIKAECPETEYFTASWDTKVRSKDGK